MILLLGEIDRKETKPPTETPEKLDVSYTCGISPREKIFHSLKKRPIFSEIGWFMGYFGPLNLFLTLDLAKSFYFLCFCPYDTVVAIWPQAKTGLGARKARRPCFVFAWGRIAKQFALID